MTEDHARARMEAQIPAIADAVSRLGIIGKVSAESLSLLPTTGLAHDHIRIADTDMVLRVPRQSQLSLDAVENLHYQQACFQRTAPSGHTPRFYAALQPQPEIPMGALLVEYINGTPIKLPEELPNAAKTLAAIHAMALPDLQHRPPLKAPKDPIKDTLDEVLEHSLFLRDNSSAVDHESIHQIEEEIAWAVSFAASSETPPVTLISFDAHPGNFIQEPVTVESPRAVLVDLEKARYGVPGFDLAHASLYTSTTWDIATYAELSTETVGQFYDTWLRSVPEALATRARGWLLPCRRIMWLWSVTWCAKWAVESGRTYLDAKHKAASTEDWSANNTDSNLINHVAGRVSTYLDPAIISHVRQDWAPDSLLTSLLK